MPRPHGRDAAGRALRLSGTMADIDQRKHAESAFAERERRFRDIAATSQEYVWETDAAGRFTYLSERAEGLLGSPRADLLGRRVADFLPPGEAPFTDQEEGFRGLVQRFVTRDGTPTWQSLSAVPMKGRRGAACGARHRRRLTARRTPGTRVEHLRRHAPLSQPGPRPSAPPAGDPRRRLAAWAGAAGARLDRFRLVNEALGRRPGDPLLPPLSACRA